MRLLDDQGCVHAHARGGRTTTTCSVLIGLLLIAVVASCGSDDEPASAGAAGPDSSPGATPDGGGGPAAPIPGIETPDETAGSRLEPLYVQTTGTDGSLQVSLDGWFDRERNEQCRYQRLADNRMHCAPYGEQPSIPRETSFADSACTKPVIGFTTYYGGNGRRCSEPDRLPSKARIVDIAPASPTHACLPPRLAELPANATPLALTQIYQMNAGKCEPSQLDPTYVTEIYDSPAPLTEINPAAFVAISVTDETPTTDQRLRISRTHYAGADGSKSVSLGRIVDSGRDVFCNPSPYLNGGRRCLPAWSASVSAATEFSDNLCKKHAWQVGVGKECSGDARFKEGEYLQVRTDTPCYALEILPAFTTQPLANIYHSVQNACKIESVSPDWGYAYYDAPNLPTAMAASAFVPLSQILEDQTGARYGKSGARLVLKYRGESAPDGFKLVHHASLFDSELDAFCSAQTLEDGKTHCAPGAPWLSYAETSTSSIFADATCVDRVVGVAKNTFQCAVQDGNRWYYPGKRKFVAENFELNGCESVRFRELPAQPAAVATAYWRDATGKCVALPAAEGTGAYDFYRPSDLKDVAPSSFIELKVAYNRTVTVAR